MYVLLIRILGNSLLRERPCYSNLRTELPLVVLFRLDIAIMKVVAVLLMGSPCSKHLSLLKITSSDSFQTPIFLGPPITTPTGQHSQIVTIIL